MLTVFGSLNCDLTFSVDHLPAPGETLLCEGYTARPGGKGGNQALAAARAGGQVAMVGCVGEDPFGDVVLRELRGAGVDLSGVQAVDAPTACASIHVDRHAENSIVVAAGANGRLTAGQWSDAQVRGSRGLVLQMEVPAAENWAVLARARAAGVTTFLSLAPVGPVPDDVWSQVDWLLVNQHEARSLLGTDTAAPDCAAAVREKFRVDCIVTLGKDGAVAATRDEVLRVPAAPANPVDTTGAGDAFAGVFAQSTVAGMALPKALRRAARAAALACGTQGAQASLPDRAAIDA